jgi:hypothetical protein
MVKPKKKLASGGRRKVPTAADTAAPHDAVRSDDEEDEGKTEEDDEGDEGKHAADEGISFSQTYGLSAISSDDLFSDKLLTYARPSSF